MWQRWGPGHAVRIIQPAFDGASKTMAVHYLRVASSVALLAIGLSQPGSASAFVTTIATGPRALYLQVGTGTMTGGAFSAGGVPADNTSVNLVSVMVPAASLGTGVLPMNSNSAVANSPLDSFAFCTAGNQVYIGGFYRRPTASGNATLTVTAPANLLNAAADTIPFSAISWVSGGAGDATPTIPSGTFSGTAAPQTLLSVTRNTWFESCLAFQYANAKAFAAGTFTGRAVYTLSTP